MKDIGSWGEKLAVKWLELQDYDLLQQNWRCRWGEIDIIARDRVNKTIAFVEVKTRSQNNWDENGLLAIDATKQKKIIKTASMFLVKYPQLAELPCRFDVALVSYIKLQQKKAEEKATEVIDFDIGIAVVMEQYQLTIENYLKSAFEA